MDVGKFKSCGKATNRYDSELVRGYAHIASPWGSRAQLACTNGADVTRLMKTVILLGRARCARGFKLL